MAQEMQGKLDFPLMFEQYSGTCVCGKDYFCERPTVALEMAICCAECGRVIPIGRVQRMKDIA